MKYITFILLLISSTTAGFAQVKHTVTKSSVTYQIKNMGFNTTGTFGSVQADINFDKNHLDNSSIEASIDAASINSDNTMRDNHLKSEDYFDVAKYPRITMKSVLFKHKSGDNYIGTFNITIKNKTKELAMPFTYTETGNQATFNGTFTIKRTDFGIGGKSMVLADDAQVTIAVQTTF